MPILLINKKVRFDYLILDTYQAGLCLDGIMVKAIRNRKINLDNCFIVNNNGNLNLINLTINIQSGTAQNKTVQLLLNKKERDEIIGCLTQVGITCIPLNLKTIGRWLKMDIAIVKGKKKYDKRESLKQKDLDRDIRRNDI